MRNFWGTIWLMSDIRKKHIFSGINATHLIQCAKHVAKVCQLDHKLTWRYPDQLRMISLDVQIRGGVTCSDFYTKSIGLWYASCSCALLYLAMCLVAPCDVTPSPCELGYKCTNTDDADTDYVTCTCKCFYGLKYWQKCIPKRVESN